MFSPTNASDSNLVMSFATWSRNAHGKGTCSLRLQSLLTFCRGMLITSRAGLYPHINLNYVYRQVSMLLFVREREREKERDALRFWFWDVCVRGRRVCVACLIKLPLQSWHKIQIKRKPLQLEKNSTDVKRKEWAVREEFVVFNQQ